MYLVIGPRDDGGYWISVFDNKKDLLARLDSGILKPSWDGKGPDLVFLDQLPKHLASCATMNEFNPNEVLLVECKIIKPISEQITTQYRLED